MAARSAQQRHAGEVLQHDAGDHEGISSVRSAPGCQLASRRTSASVMRRPSRLRSRLEHDAQRHRQAQARKAGVGQAGSEWKRPLRPAARKKRFRV
jgi:hypothetical protein